MINVRRLVGRWGVVSGVLIAGLFFAGCKSAKSEQSFADVVHASNQRAVGSPAEVSGTQALTSAANSAGVETPGLPMGDSAETLREGDSLTIIFSDLGQVTPPFAERINDQGNITLPYNQTFHAAGKTRGQLEKEIRERYVPKIYTYMTPTVSPLERFYHVTGEVRAPTRQMYVGRMTVLKAIGSCGDFTDFANKKKVTLTRGDGRILVVNCIKALQDPSLDLEVFPNDTIHVPRKWW